MPENLLFLVISKATGNNTEENVHSWDGSSLQQRFTEPRTFVAKVFPYQWPAYISSCTGSSTLFCRHICLSNVPLPTGNQRDYFLLGLTNWQISDKYWHLSDRFWHFAQFFGGQMHFCPYFCLNLLRIFVSMFWLARVDVEFLLEWIQNSKQICTDSHDTWNEITL